MEGLGGELHWGAWHEISKESIKSYALKKVPLIF